MFFSYTLIRIRLDLADRSSVGQLCLGQKRDIPKHEVGFVDSFDATIECNHSNTRYTIITVSYTHLTLPTNREV